MKIKRFDIAEPTYADESPDGRWVRYEDHAAEVKRLKDLLRLAQIHTRMTQQFVEEVQSQLDDNDPADDWKKGGAS